MTDIILSAAVFTAILLFYGAWRIQRQSGATKQMWLMVAAGAVIVMNIAIWIIPVENGKSLIDESRTQED